jgi:hypothetical protein
MTPDTRAAQEILDQIAQIYQPTHRFVPARPADFRHLDLRWYDRTAAALTQRGFRRLGDLEDRTVTEAGGVLAPAMLRTMRSGDGAVVAALYHARIRAFPLRVLLWLLRKLPGTVVDMETECTDGSFVVTTTAPAIAGALEMPAMIATEYLPKGTTAQAVFERHEARVCDHLAARPGVTARRLLTLDDVLAAQHRLNALKAAFRGEIGGVTREELERLTPRMARGVVPAVHAALEQERLRRAS